MMPASERLVCRLARRKRNLELEQRLLAEFKTAVLAAVGLAGHPKADKAFDYAWDTSANNGLTHVYYQMQELADLMLP